MFGKNYRYSYFRISLAKVNSKGLEFISSKFSSKRNIIIEKLLKKGTYMMMIEPIWQNQRYNFNIGGYTSSMIFIDQCDYFNDQEYNRLELLFWKDFSIKNPK